MTVSFFQQVLSLDPSTSPHNWLVLCNKSETDKEKTVEVLLSDVDYNAIQNGSEPNSREYLKPNLGQLFHIYVCTSRECVKKLNENFDEASRAVDDAVSFSDVFAENLDDISEQIYDQITNLFKERVKIVKDMEQSIPIMKAMISRSIERTYPDIRSTQNTIRLKFKNPFQYFSFLSHRAMSLLNFLCSQAMALSICHRFLNTHEAIFFHASSFPILL